MNRLPDFVWLVGLLLVGNFWIKLVNFWMARHVGDFTHPALLWTVGTVLLCPSSYLLLYAYAFGYHRAFPDNMWLVQATSWATNVALAFFTIWIIFHGLPAKNVVLAIAGITVAFAAIFWK